METHPYGWLSLLPPIIAIVLAIATRKATLSLLIGLFCGALITTRGNPLVAVYETLEFHLWRSFADQDKLRLFAFTLSMGGMIGVINASGGMQGLIGLLTPLAKTRRGGQLATWCGGILIFFDDYANAILLGGAMRPLCDRLKISREKLALLVDSTSAPVAGLSLLSTWVAFEINCIRDGVESLSGGSDLSAMDLFIGSVPYRFYMGFTLFFVLLVALLGRDFGPMLKAERLSLRSAPREDSLIEDIANRPARWINAVLPIGATLATVLWLMVRTGGEKLDVATISAAPPLRDILGAADSGLALKYGALLGLAIAVALCRWQRILTWEQISRAASRGALMVLPAILILWSATALSRMTGNRDLDGRVSTTAYEHQEHRLYTGEYLSNLFLASAESQAPTTRSDATPGSTLAVKLLPTVTFLLASVLSFATGTSFGAMGILTPMVVTLANTLLIAAHIPVHSQQPLLLACVGNVLSGAIFGDHCSPISDTTILSSQSCQCDHMAHVVTQLPYALTVAVVCVVGGTLPLGWGAPLSIVLPLQAVLLVAILWLFGQRVEETRMEGSLA